MKEDPRVTRVGVLMEQNRFAEAEKILAELLADYPNDALYLYLLAEVCLQQDKHEKAGHFADLALGINPDDSDLYYVKSRIAADQEKMDVAEKFIEQAIGIDPRDANYFAFWASIKLVRKQYGEALEIANRALELDAENLLALNTRSTALNKLDRSEEAFATIEGALREDPNNPHTHTGYGWGLLEKGDHKKALEHFKEALKNDPSLKYAQMGMLEAIKAANPIYRVFLKYAFWISNLTAKYQWGVILGFYFGFRALKVLAKNSPSLEPYLTPLIILLGVLAFSTWIITPISNLFLRFNKYGQLLLDEAEKKSSNFVALSLGLSVLGAVLYFALKDERFLSIAVFGFTMMLPLGSMFSQGSGNATLRIYTISLAVVGALAIGVTFLTGVLVNLFSLIFILGFIGFQWVANYFSIKNSNY